MVLNKTPIVDGMDIVGNELRQGIQLCLALAPVIIGHPVLREFLHRRQLHPLRRIRN
jgi:hypothetical protein